MEKIKDFIYGLNPTYVAIVAFLFLVLTTVLLTMWLVSLSKSEQLKNSYQKATAYSRELMIENMKVSKLKAFNYDEIKMYMSRSGLDFMTDGKLTPLTYLALRLAFGFIFLVCGIQLANVVVGIMAAVVGFFALDFILNISDKSDNDKMLDDIKNIYDTLRIQTKAGVYITSVITDCYLVVQNKRLKQALLELTSDIIAKNDTEDALDTFRNKFNNPYIDTMVIIIKQSMKTGQASKMFDDIKVQIVDIEAAMMLAEQVKIKAEITFVQILMYIAIIVVAILLAFLSLSSGLNF